MLLVDHQNPVVKIALVISILTLFFIGAIKTGHLSLKEQVKNTASESATIVPAYNPRSQAFRNPVTGAFEHRTDTSLSNAEMTNGSFSLMSSRALVTSSVAAGTVEDFNGAKVIAMPERMRSHLVAKRTQNGIEFHHEALNTSQMEQDEEAR